MNIQAAFEDFWNCIFGELTVLTINHGEETEILRQRLHQALVERNYQAEGITYRWQNRQETVTIDVPEPLQEMLGSRLRFRSSDGSTYPYERLWRPRGLGLDKATRDFFRRERSRLVMNRGVSSSWQCHNGQCSLRGTYTNRCKHFPN